MKTEVYRFIDLAVTAAVTELAFGSAKVAELKLEGGNEVLWVVLTDRRKESLACFTGKTIDQDTLVGTGPTFFVKERTPGDLHVSVRAFLSERFAGALSLSVELYTGASISTSLLMKGDTTNSVMRLVEKEAAIGWEPIGPSGFGC